MRAGPVCHFLSGNCLARYLRKTSRSAVVALSSLPACADTENRCHRHKATSNATHSSNRFMAHLRLHCFTVAAENKEKTTSAREPDAPARDSAAALAGASGSVLAHFAITFLGFLFDELSGVGGGTCGIGERF